MQLLHLPNGVIINLDQLAFARKFKNNNVTLYFASYGGKGASIVTLKEGEGAVDLWMYLEGECADKDRNYSQPQHG